MAETVSEPSIAYSTSAAATMITTISTLSSPMATGDEAAVSVDPVAVLPTKLPRDSSWLELEICRDFVRGCCNYNADECRFAHPEPGVITKGDKATCCYDFLKDRCHRERCKYFHPPLHIKQKLVAAGKQFGAMMSNAYMLPGVTYPMSPALSPASSVVPVVGPDGQLMSSPMHGSYLPAAAVFPPWEAMNDRLLICPEFVRGVCNIPLCPFVHPEPHIRQNMDCTVTVCRDFVRGGCSRKECRYYHPLPHIAALMTKMATMGPYWPQGMMMSPAVVPGFGYHPTSPVAPIPIVAPSPITTPVTSASIPVCPGFPAVPGPIPPGVPISAGVYMPSPSPVPAAVVPMQPVQPVQLEASFSPTTIQMNGHVSAENFSAPKNVMIPSPIQLIQ